MEQDIIEQNLFTNNLLNQIAQARIKLDSMERTCNMVNSVLLDKKNRTIIKKMSTMLSKFISY